MMVPTGWSWVSKVESDVGGAEEAQTNSGQTGNFPVIDACW
jgi:hypothetical protein